MPIAASLRLIQLPLVLLALLVSPLTADTFWVTNTSGDQVPGSLLQAIADAEAHPGYDFIHFNIVGSPPFVIRPTSTPTLTDATSLDGRTQAGWNLTPIVEIDGSLAPDAGLRVTSDETCFVFGLAIYNCVNGIHLDGAQTTLIWQCYVGVDADGQARGNGISATSGAGILVDGCVNSLIGTGNPFYGNLISGNSCGVRVLGGATGTLVSGNRIGLDEAGTGPLGTQSCGVMVHDATDTRVSRNRIANHVGNGVWVRDPVGGGCCDGMQCEITENAIFCNGGAGIQLGHPPFPGNDPLDGDTGPNELQNEPEIEVAFAFPDHLFVGGRLDSAPSSDYTIELFANSTCTGGGDAEIYLGEVDLTTAADGTVDFGFSLPDADYTGYEIRGTATDPFGNTSPISTTAGVVALSGTVLHVDPDAPGSQTGADWMNAFHDLQDALDAALAVPSFTEIRVAAGLYRPSRETSPGDPRSVTFTISDGLAVRGGFAGWGAPDPDLQDPPAHSSHLSGDLLQNDLSACCPLTVGGDQENAYHVVDLSGTGPGTLLEAFTIRNGNADGPPPFNSGGGLFLFGSEATIRRCGIFGNQAAFQGGGIYSAGGGIPTYEDCFIWQNLVTGSSGGGMHQGGSGLLELRRCSFRGNHAPNGNGGALSLSTTQLRLFDCELAANEAGGSGGAIYSGFSGTGTIEALNCTLHRNRAPAGEAIWCWNGVTVRNSIVWVGLPGTFIGTQLYSNTGSVTATYSCIENWTAGGDGNFDADPRFVDGTGRGVPTTTDLHLFVDSPCIDAGDNGAVAGSTTDLEGGPRFLDDPFVTDTGVGSAPIVDLGAYERESTGLGTPFCFGDGSGASCPCFNSSPTTGESCLHSGGTGMTIRATGSTSIAADDLVVVVEGCPPGNAGLIYSGTIPLAVPNQIWDGLQCTLGATRRYQPQFQAGGVFTDTGFVAQDPTGDYFVAGGAYHFQLWTRDAASGPSPCGSGANYSPTYAVVMVP